MSKKNMPDVVLVLTTFPDETVARQIGASLIEAQLAACVNLCPGVSSIYCWKGEVRTDAEVMGWFKTTPGCRDILMRRLVELHPYECPEVLAFDAIAGWPPYGEWVSGSVKEPD